MSLKDSWNNLSVSGKIVAWMTFISTMFGLITGLTPAVSALDSMGLPVMATRAWVRDDNGQLRSAVTSLTMKQNDMQLDTLNGKLEAAVAARNKLELDKLNYDDRGKVLADQEMRRLQDTIDLLNEQKRSIRGGRGPQ